MDIPAHLDELTRRHQELRVEAASVRRALDAAGVPARIKHLFSAFADAIAFHVQREEDFLFPGVRALVEGRTDGPLSVRGTIATLEIEHEELLELQEAVRARAEDAGDLAPRIVRFLDHYEAHNEAEDRILFPAVLALLGDDLGVVHAR